MGGGGGRGYNVTLGIIKFLPREIERVARVMGVGRVRVERLLGILRVSSRVIIQDN